MRDETLSALLERRAAAGGPCLIAADEYLDGVRLLRNSRALATGLAGLGVMAGERVAIWLPNSAQWVEAFFACARLGAIAAAINTRFRSAEVADVLSRTQAKVLLCQPGFKDIDFARILASCPHEALAHLRAVVCCGAPADASADTPIAGRPAIPYASLLHSQHMPGDAATPDSGCILFTTSGTTKAPKLVLHRQRNVLAHAMNVAHQYRLDPPDRMLLVPPLCGVFGFCTVMAALVAAVPIILEAVWHAETHADLIERHRVTHLTASNEALAQLLACRSGTRVFPTLKFAAVADMNPAHADIAARAHSKGVAVAGLYGSSELQALLALNPPRPQPGGHADTRAGGQLASAVAKVRACDPQTRQPCAAGTIGELEFLAPESRFVQYFGDEQATRAAFTADGYFKSGDLGLANADGSFTYLARMGDALRLGGFLVNPAEIETVIQQHPAVEGCQVVGAHTADGAIKPVAFVVAKPGTEVSERSVIGFAAERLARYKLPYRVVVLPKFPMISGANGTKVQKHVLRTMANEWVQRQPQR